jgi:hypothetical protein
MGSFPEVTLSNFVQVSSRSSSHVRFSEVAQPLLVPLLSQTQHRGELSNLETALEIEARLQAQLVLVRKLAFSNELRKKFESVNNSISSVRLCRLLFGAGVLNLSTSYVFQKVA